MDESVIRERLEYLRGELRAERISWGELAELQGLAEQIPADDVELREAAGLPEHPDERVTRVTLTFSFDVDDEQAFIAQANERSLREWGSSIDDLTHDGLDPLVQAAYETFVASNGEAWPEGVADDANADYDGSVVR